MVIYTTLISILLILTQICTYSPGHEYGDQALKKKDHCQYNWLEILLMIWFFKGKFRSVLRCFENLHGVLPKFCFREKWRQKFHEWRKMYCLDLFQMHQFRVFFNELQTCVFQCKSSKRQNGSKRMGFFQSDIPLLISNILIWADMSGRWELKLFIP